MDYQHSGWFRPACGPKCYQGTPYSAAQNRNTESQNQESTSQNWHMEGTSLAMVYSPCQSFIKRYEPCKALSRGTLFAELDKPFSGKC